MKKLLEIKNIHTKVKDLDKQILKGLDLTVNKGEIHVIMGPNGAGKSTLANTIFNNPEYERRRKKEISKSAKNTYINKSNTKTPLDVFFDKLKPNNVFVGSNGIKTSVINYGKTINGTRIVVLHGDNLTFKYYLTLVSFINGMPNFQLCGEFTNIESAERELANLKSR